MGVRDGVYESMEATQSSYMGWKEVTHDIEQGPKRVTQSSNQGYREVTHIRGTGYLRG